MTDKHQSDTSSSQQFKEDTFVSDESIQEFQEDLREAEKERLQTGQRRKEMMDDLRESFHSKDTTTTLQENKKENERLFTEGSIQDLDNISKTLHREIQSLQSKEGISKTAKSLFQSFQTKSRALIEKKKLYETIQSNVNHANSDDNLASTQKGIDPQKLPSVLQALSRDIQTLSQNLLTLYQQLDETLFSDLESEAFAQQLFYSSMALIKGDLRQKVIRLCKTKCQKAMIEQRTTVYKKLVEQLAAKEKQIARLIHQMARAKAREYEKLSYQKLAVKELCFAVSLDKDDASTYRMLYKLFITLGDEQKAFTSLRQMLRLKPEDNVLRKKVARYWQKLGQLSNAIEEYKILVEHPKEDIATRKELGELYFEHQNFSDVPSALQPYLEQYPQDMEAKKWVAISFMNCELYSNAIREFEELLEAFPDDTECMKHLVYSYRKINLHQQAVDLLTGRMKNHPQQHVLRLMLGAVYQENGDWKEAGEVYETLLQSGMQSSSVLLAAAQVKQMFHQDETAMQYVKQAAEMDPKRWDVWLELGKMQRNAMQLEEAENTFKKAAELSAANPAVHQEQMLLYSMTGDWEKASQVMSQSKSINSLP